MEEIIALLEKLKVIPVISIEDPGKALPLADALIEGGLPLAEITFRTEAAARAISIMARERPEMNVCAGTVLNSDQLKKARDAGARFGVAPGFDPALVEEASRINFPFVPGVLTPSEVTMAINHGLKLLKYFPAETSGGIKLLKSIIAPFAHLDIKFSPTGGIGKDTYQDYLNIPQVISVGGSWVAGKEDINQANWEKIKSNCLEITSK
jgi:2-dehydro-3-deoxyphosphogluconate aldolase/(4S)-4-hydroxy-2-oxoglutarate aldolase